MATSFRACLGVPASVPTTSDSVLLLIDIQNEYDHGFLAIKDFRTSADAISKLLERYRAAGGALIHVLHRAPAGAPIFTPGSGLDQPFAAVAPRDGETVVWKESPISFTGTPLESLIEATGLKKLVVVGYMAHVCVSGTVRVAYEKGYEVSVARDCVGDRDIPGCEAEELVKVVMAEMGDVFATVLNSGDIE